jgi:hypothetical protein
METWLILMLLFAQRVERPQMDPTKVAEFWGSVCGTVLAGLFFFVLWLRADAARSRRGKSVPSGPSGKTDLSFLQAPQQQQQPNTTWQPPIAGQPPMVQHPGPQPAANSPHMVACPHCHAALQYNPALSGQAVACPHCHQPFRML